MPTIGEFFCVRTEGWAALGIRVVTSSDVNHAGVYVGDGMIVEAQPAGARLVHASLYPGALWSGPALTQGRGDIIADHARQLVGTPYSWWDCVCIGIADVLGRKVPGFIRARLERTDRLMCSALVDYAYDLAGVHLYADGRLFGDVSPGDLRQLIAH